MCGIFGGISFDNNFFPEIEDLKTGSEYLKFRGPDDNGILYKAIDDVNVFFTHTRLSIIDLSKKGQQPLWSQSQQSVIVYNGEIYNYKTLKDELLKLNYKFNSDSDTEVIVSAFECWGIEKTLHKLDGMFAFALYDKKNRILYLARDRFGKKPLYYICQQGRILFSSDIRSFLSIKGIKVSLDLHALGYYFAELTTPKEASIWKEIKKMKPAHFLSFHKDGIKAYRKYWKLNYSENCSLNRDQIIERTDYLLKKAVKKRLVSDVRVAALVSGGIDSSLVVAKMAELSRQRIKTYSVGFKDQKFDELPFAREVASKFNTDHTEYIIDSVGLNNYKRLIYEYGEPFADSSMIPTYLISNEISKTEKVVIGGDGGDELFGGYHSYYFAFKYDKVKQFRFFYPFSKILRILIPSYRINFLSDLLSQTRFPPYTLLNRKFGLNENELKILYDDQNFYQALANEHSRIWEESSQKSDHDLINVLSTSLNTRLLNDYLVKIDRASMYASLEMRSPFLDKDLAEFVSTLTPNQLFFRGEPKSISKKLSEKYFTSSFINRKKMGFRIPIGNWLRTELKDEVKEIILGGKQALINLNYNLIESIIEKHISGKQDNAHKIWAFYVFHIWANSLEK